MSRKDEPGRPPTLASIAADGSEASALACWG